MSDYPEHDKQHKIINFSQKCGEFLEWLQEEKGLFLAIYGTRVTDADRLYIADPSVTRLLAEFFEIDQDKLEAEKRAMLDELRAGYLDKENVPE